MKFIESMIQNVSSIKTKHYDLSVKTGNGFNVFNILGLTSDEMSHSKMIAYLLNQNANHGQSDLFLKRFIANILELPIEKQFHENVPHVQILKRFKTEKSIVTIEKVIGTIDMKNGSGGRIDILISNGEDYIIIENKIFAQDQESQLVRYKNFKPNIETPIFYLTLFGDQASEYSKRNNDQLLREREDYLPISYSEFICKWIEDCISLVIDKPFIRETLMQYLNLIKELTNQSINKMMKNDLAQLLSKNYLDFKEILNVQNDVHQILLEEAKIVLENMCQSKKIELTLFDLKYGTSYTSFTIKNDLLEKLNIQFCVEFESGQFYFGVVKLNDQISNDSEIKKIQNEFKKFYPTFKTTSSWPVFIKFEECLNYNVLCELIFKKEFEALIENKMTEVLGIIEQSMS